MPGRPSISKLAAQEAKNRPELVRPANQPKPKIDPSDSKSTSENQTTSNTATIRPASGGGKALKRKSSKGSKKGSSAPRSKKSRVTTEAAVVVSSDAPGGSGRARRIPSGRVSIDGQTVVGPARGGGKHLTRLVSSCSTSTAITSTSSVYSGPTGFRETPSLATSRSSASLALLSDDEPSSRFSPVSNPLSEMCDPVVDPLQSAMARAAAASVEIPQQVVSEDHSQEDMGQIVDQDGIVVEDDVPDFNFTFPSEEGQANCDCCVAEESSSDAIKEEETAEAKPATVASVNKVVGDKPMAVVQSVAKRTLERDPAKDIQCSAVPHSCDEVSFPMLDSTVVVAFS